jgi:hypothetical protein
MSMLPFILIAFAVVLYIAIATVLVRQLLAYPRRRLRLAWRSRLSVAPSKSTA